MKDEQKLIILYVVKVFSTRVFYDCLKFEISSVTPSVPCSTHANSKLNLILQFDLSNVDMSATGDRWRH